MGIQISVHVEEWSTRAPFRITKLVRNSFRMIVVELTDGPYVGRGEGLPVHYLNETADSLAAQVEAVADHVERGVSRSALLDLMPAGGARKAIDTALWDLEAKRAGKSIWNLIDIKPRSIMTALTIGIEDTPEAMAARALEGSEFSLLKIKVDRDRPVERVAAIRSVRPDARLLVDANQGWAFDQLVEVAPRLAELGVVAIEQPLSRGADTELERYRSPIPLCADESCQDTGELDEAAARYQLINVKLDKAGGLTEGLRLAKRVREKGLGLWIGNMGGTSLSMAPTFVMAQLGQYVELDGPRILKHDRCSALVFRNGMVQIPDTQLWG